MKRSSGQVRHGYETQLEIYKDAANTQFGIFVVMNFGGLGDKLTQIQQIQKNRRDNGEPASDIIVIDATKKASASKRRCTLLLLHINLAAERAEFLAHLRHALFPCLLYRFAA